MKCPAKPITHAFIHFSDNDEMVKYVRSANMSKKEVRGRKTKILPAMDAEERFHQKNWDTSNVALTQNTTSLFHQSR